MLNSDEKAFYEENGYIVVRGMFTLEECATLRTECHNLAERLMQIKNINAAWGSAKELEGAAETVVLHCHDVQFQSAAFARLIVDERFTGVAASIIGPNVQLHHSKMFINVTV